MSLLPNIFRTGSNPTFEASGIQQFHPSKRTQVGLPWVRTGATGPAENSKGVNMVRRKQRTAASKAAGANAARAKHPNQPCIEMHCAGASTEHMYGEPQCSYVWRLGAVVPRSELAGNKNQRNTP